MHARHHPLQNPVEAIDFRRAGAGGNAQHRNTFQSPEHHQIAGIDRHAEMHHLAARRRQRRRDDVAAVDDGRGAEHQDGMTMLRLELADRLAHRGDRVVADDDGDEFAVKSCNPCAHRRFRLGGQRRLGLRQAGDDQSHLLVPKRFDANDRLVADDGQRLGENVTRHREGNDLHCRHHLALLHHRMAGGGGERQAFVQPIERPNPRHIDQRQAMHARMQIGAAGEGGLRRSARTTGHLGDGRSRLVLRHIVGAEPCRENFAYARLGDRRHVLRRQHPAFLEHASRMFHRVRQDRALGTAHRNFAEVHVRTPAAGRGSFPP